MVANIRCAELLEEQLHALEHDSAWASLRDAAAAGPVREFGARAAALLESCISGTPWRRASGAPREHARLRRGCLHCVPGILRVFGRWLPAFGCLCAEQCKGRLRHLSCAGRGAVRAP